jgi:DNA-binding CsgD family transcriptional regulator
LQAVPAFQGPAPGNSGSSAPNINRATRLITEPSEPHIGEFDALLQSSAARELLMRACGAVGAVHAARTDSLESWLDLAGASLVQFCEGLVPGTRLSSVWLACVTQDTMSAPPRVNIGVWGVTPEASAVRLRDAAAGWSSSARLNSAGPTTTLTPTDGPATEGEHALLRCTLPLRWAGTPRWLVCEVRSPAHKAPGKTLVAGVELMVQLLAGALEQGFARVETHRQRLLMRVSPAQQPIMPHLATGKSQRQIALIVGRSLHTVHDHVKSIYSTLGVSSRYQFQRLWNGQSVDPSDQGDDE